MALPQTTKHVFVTGGVASSLGKGLTASSLGSGRFPGVPFQKLFGRSPRSQQAPRNEFRHYLAQVLDRNELSAARLIHIPA